ncbi:unnamed protein product [Plutella xylostella]|uniref:(diamondback moth) hypothetical protein n=1 Tax=Plutella xylostella TaxID=51655 RepID=A0A8S4GFC4_PLUXY|nr:unnamed protein product [Plutella xylostella]
MRDTVAAILNGCDACQRMKYDRKPIKPVLQLTQTQDAPFQEVFIDLFTIDGIYYLTLVDAFSKLAQAIEVTNRSTPEVIRALIKYFSYYGIPKKITCDPGKEFNNELMKELMTMYKIDLHITTPNNPNSTSIVERFYSTIIEIYRLAKYDQKCTDAASVMTYAILAYNNTIHSTTELTPFEVVFGHTDSSKIFEGNFEKNYMQQLLKDHAKRTKFLYKHIAQMTLLGKEKVKEKKGDQDKRFNELQQTIGGIKEQNDALTNSVDLMSQKYDEFITRIAQLEAERKEDKKLIHILEEKIEYLEKKNRTTGIEIRNIPKATGETKQDLCKLVQKLGNTLKIDIKYSDVKDIYRINTKDGTNPIVAELTTVLLKENIIKEVKSFNKNKNKGEKLNTTHFNSHQPMKPVFVSETLTILIVSVQTFVRVANDVN